MVMGTGTGDIGALMGEFHNNLFSGEKFPKPQSFIDQDQFLDIPDQGFGPSASVSPDGVAHDDAEIFSDIALSYISQMLMDEDDAGGAEGSALEAAEKPFYEILGKKYPPSPSPAAWNQSPGSNLSSDSPDSSSPHYGSSSGTSGGGGGASSGSSGGPEYNWPHEYSDSQLPIEFATPALLGTSYGFANPFLGSLEASFFNKGVEEARKFLPSNNKLVIDLEATGISLPAAEAKKEPNNNLVEVKPEKEEREYHQYTSFELRGRKNPHSDDLDLEEGRSVKHSAVSSESPLRTEEFDEVLLCNGDKLPKAINDLREALQQVANKTAAENGGGSAKGGNGGKGRGRRQPKKEVVDLRTLLVHCAQMVAADDQRSTTELLKQIRQHSSPTGDGSQRLAHYFASGLEARLAGTGSDIYNSFQAQRRTATDFLKAYQLYMAACPFKKISHFFSNQTILDVAKGRESIHVVDFGIHFGFQWPSLIQRLASRQGGPPKLRITGIDLPQPGFRPAERIEETGRRLAEYARIFGVPFEYKAIASKWEEVRVEDLSIDAVEVLVVNCLFQFRYLADETVVVDSPRNIVLNTIRKMNPAVFIHGIINGSYNAPFFVTRFREALYHFSAVFDMLETVVPREDEQRLLIEREIFGREVLNVVACEGLERRERPETYKQWQVRILRAGFAQHHLHRDIMKKARDKVKTYYHKDFNIDEDSRWLLQGWKGRIIYALSTWKPNNLP